MVRRDFLLSATYCYCHSSNLGLANRNEAELNSTPSVVAIRLGAHRNAELQTCTGQNFVSTLALVWIHETSKVKLERG